MPRHACMLYACVGPVGLCACMHVCVGGGREAVCRTHMHAWTEKL